MQATPPARRILVLLLAAGLAPGSLTTAWARGSSGGEGSGTVRYWSRYRLAGNWAGTAQPRGGEKQKVNALLEAGHGGGVTGSIELAGAGTERWSVQGHLSGSDRLRMAVSSKAGGKGEITGVLNRGDQRIDGRFRVKDADGQRHEGTVRLFRLTAPPAAPGAGAPAPPAGTGR